MMTYMGLGSAEREGRMAVYWSWYCSPRRSDGAGRSWGRNVIGNRAYNPGTMTFGQYPGWRVMRSQPHRRYGVAGGNRGARRKVHMVRDQIVAKHRLHEEQRMTRWVCGAYTFAGVLQEDATTVCSRCLLVAQHRTVEPLPENRPRPERGEKDGVAPGCRASLSVGPPAVGSLRPTHG